MYKRQLEDRYLKDNLPSFEKMLGSMLSKVKYAKLIHYLSTDGQLDGIKIKNLLIGDITELTRAVSSIGKIEGEKEEEGFHKLYKNFTDRKLGKEWAEKIGVTICPYCNRSLSLIHI